MRRLFIGNFDFEYEIAGRGASVSAAARNESTLRAYCLNALASDDDLLLLDAEPDRRFLDAAAANGLPRLQVVSGLDDAGGDAIVVPWGWTERCRRLSSQSQAIPDATAVRKVNSRSFSVELEHELGVAPHGLRLCRSVEDVAEAVRAMPSERRWVVKAQFGAAGREQLCGCGTDLPQAKVNWATKRIRQDAVVAFEPWFDAVGEAGIQLEISRSGDVELLGVVPQICDANGQYRGSRFDADQSLVDAWQPAVEVALRVAARCHRAGYFGPLGIDAMQYRDDEGPWLRPIQDVNARLTMGRVALGLRRLLQPGERGWHLRLTGEESQLAESAVELLGVDAGSIRAVIPTSPASVGGATTRTAVVASTA